MIEPIGALSLLVFGMALLIAMGLVYGAIPVRGGSVELLLRLTALVVLVVGLLGLLIALAGLGGLILWLGGGVVVALALVQIRIDGQRAFLDLLALAAEKQMPLTSVVRAFAADQPAGDARRLRQLAAELEGGMPLGQALKRGRWVLPRQAVVAAQLGERTGTLQSALRQAARDYAFSMPLRQTLLGRLAYLTCLVYLISYVFAYVGRRILPAIINICHDFDVPLPAPTVILSNVCYVDTNWHVGILPPLLCTMALVYFILYFIGVVPAPTFGLGVLAERGHVLRALALAVESRRPLGEALHRLAENYPRQSIAQRLSAAADAVVAGGDWVPILVRYALIGRGDLAVMQAAQRVGNLPWAMRQVADASERRLVYRLETALDTVSPLVALALAVVVFGFALGCFVPLVRLILSLT